MLDTIILAAVQLLTQVLPLINDSSQIAKAIELLVQILPAVEKLAVALVQPIKNIIAALSANPAADADQLKALQDLDAKYDAAFEAAATAAEAQDSAS